MFNIGDVFGFLGHGAEVTFMSVLEDPLRTSGGISLFKRRHMD
jgi:hypothetical protein